MYLSPPSNFPSATANNSGTKEISLGLSSQLATQLAQINNTASTPSIATSSTVAAISGQFKLRINEIVELACAIPEKSLDKGTVGVIVEQFSYPEEAYEVEFCNEEGITIAQVVLKPDQLVLRSLYNSQNNSLT